jgi:hypothetical protein
LFRSSRHHAWLGAALFALVPACNLVIGNEDGVLEDTDASAPDAPTVDPEDDATTEAEPEGSVTDPEASLDPDAPGVDEAAIEAARPDAILIEDAPREAGGKDASKDAADDRRDAAACETGASVCAEGQVATEMQMCGPCGRGVQTRKRTCAPGGCGWGDWSAWSACSVTTAECMPGQTGTESQACGPCNTGTQSRTRSCTSACTWGAWGAFGACGNITAECLPDHWRCCGAGKWEWCYTNSCKWTGGCAPCNGSCQC